MSSSLLAGKAFDSPKREVWAAYLQVRANKGAPGIDGQSLDAFEEDLKGNLYRIWNRMSSGSYFPPPVRAVEIPKATGGVRTLGVPTVADRMHRIAAASTVASHHCHVLWTTLAERVAQDRTGPLGVELQRAAGQARCAREHWLDAAREFEGITTDVRGQISPAAAEAAELALWTGRLAYADPDWTLTSGPSQTPRATQSLAPRLADVSEAVAAVHEASDALSGLASANLEQARKAVGARRLLVSTRSLPEKYNVPRRFTLAPASYTTSLLACCQETGGAAAEAAAIAAGIASRVGAPSRTLAAAREAVRDQRQVQQIRYQSEEMRAGEGEPERAVGPVEARLRHLGVTGPRLLWRASAIDQAGQRVISDATADLSQRRQRRLVLVASQAAGHPAAAEQTRVGRKLAATAREEAEAEA